MKGSNQHLHLSVYDKSTPFKQEKKKMFTFGGKSLQNS